MSRWEKEEQQWGIISREGHYISQYHKPYPTERTSGARRKVTLPVFKRTVPSQVWFRVVAASIVPTRKSDNLHGWCGEAAYFTATQWHRYEDFDDLCVAGVSVQTHRRPAICMCLVWVRSRHAETECLFWQGDACRGQSVSACETAMGFCPTFRIKIMGPQLCCGHSR